MQQNHCNGVLSNDWNTLLGQQISQHTAMSRSRSLYIDNPIDGRLMSAWDAFKATFFFQCSLYIDILY